MTYTKEEVARIYNNELSVLPSLDDENAKKLLAKYTKPQLVSMAIALYGEEFGESVRRQDKLMIVRNIRLMVEGVDRALRMKP